MAENLFDLMGKVVLITGASRGLGQYYGRALARAGADLAITALPGEEQPLKEFAGEIASLGRRAECHALDVRDVENIRSVVDAVEDAFGHIDVLVNNAGCNIRKPAVEVTPDDWDTVLETNLRGSFFMAQAVAKKMITRRKGRIINIGSVTCVAGYAGMAPYCASRGGVRQLTMSLADDWGPHGITVNCLAPGWFKTAQNAVMYEDREWVDYLIDRIPLERPGLPNDLDGIIVFLASDACAYMTGQTILVDGGISTGATRALPKNPGR
jgi:gluconate 5-dehydrogenase